jgi:hypothetical protein
MKKKQTNMVMGCDIHKFIEIDVYKLNIYLNGRAKVLTKEEEYERFNNNSSAICVDILENSNKCFDTILKEIMNVNRVYSVKNSYNTVCIMFD